MSEEKNLGDDLKDKANNAAKEAKESAKEFSEEAKSTAKEFKEGWNEATNSGDNKKILAGILGIVLGGFGVHKFVLGYNKEGIILLSATLVSCLLMCVFIGFFTIYIPILIGFVEGIIYLTKSDEDFYNTYQLGKKPWF